MEHLFINARVFNQSKIRPVPRVIVALLIHLNDELKKTREKIMLKIVTLQRFSYDLEMESGKENRNNKRTEIERFHWFSERIQTRVTARVNFIAINGYFTLTSYCNTIGQSNNAFPY